MDSGGTWRAVNKGLDNEFVLALALDPSAPPVLYAGTAGEAVFALRQGE